MGCLMKKDPSMSIKVLNQRNLQQLCMDMVYSTLCSSEFSERGWVSSKSGLCHYYANSICLFHVHLNVYLVNVLCLFFFIEMADYVILKNTFQVLRRIRLSILYIHAYCTARFVAHGMLMVHNGILATGKWNQCVWS